ncbi:MaoC family dehydratase [Kribbia dieselivorans]|uniref:MaoC family dehydratase n=1 Tax=Kribbia dieselivorans TaxID=331526 RepID=UPI0009FA5DFC|nr:MaoC family dehydratase [Kribbia dieselivorans]
MALHNVVIADLTSLVGQRLGPTDPVKIDQDMIDSFADVTRDRQWIHVDPQRAAQSTFGSTIAHGYLTLSLAIHFFWELLDVTDAEAIINYGLEKVRFPAPLPVGRELVMYATVNEVKAIPGGANVTSTWELTEPGAARPACVAQPIFRYTGGNP